MQSVSSIIADDLWAIAEGEHGGMPLIVRFRRALSARPDVRAHPELIKVSWNYRGEFSGLPDPATSAAMSAFEQRLLATMERDAAALLAAVVTYNNGRVWIFYAGGMSVFGERLQMLMRDSPLPIEIESESDPEWRFLYQNVLAGVAGWADEDLAWR